jgi:hypothetical protein
MDADRIFLPESLTPSTLEHLPPSLARDGSHRIYASPSRSQQHSLMNPAYVEDRLTWMVGRAPHGKRWAIFHEALTDWAWGMSIDDAGFVCDLILERERQERRST